MSASVSEKASKLQDMAGDDKELLTSEKWWRDHYDVLEAHGYRLRPRYKPGWIPPWKESGKSRRCYEERFWTFKSNVIDAARIKDGKVVFIKRIRRSCRELSIALFLSRMEDGNSDPRNHCVPILDHFTDDTLPNATFLVMPHLRRFNDPPFFSVDEVLEFMKQTLEGLSYMHSRGVAHRDCSFLNIMFEPSSMYPKGFHPVITCLDRSGLKVAHPRNRREVRGVRYYITDFGISTRFEENVKHEERRATGINGQDRDVPELSDYEPYDPFAVDVFILGNLLRKTFLENYSNFSFLRDLIRDMTNAHPGERPLVDEALGRFDVLVAGQPQMRLRRRLKEKDAGLLNHVFIDITSAFREGLSATGRFVSPFVCSQRE